MGDILHGTFPTFIQERVHLSGSELYVQVGSGDPH